MNLLKRCCWVFLKFDFFLLHGLKCNSLPTSKMCFLQDQHITVQQVIPFTFSATCTHSITHKHIYTQEHTSTHTHTHTDKSTHAHKHTHTHKGYSTASNTLYLLQPHTHTRKHTHTQFTVRPALFSLKPY